MSRQVKGVLFVDYVRMIRAYKVADWSKRLSDDDLALVSRTIDPDDWYPMDVYERLGLAILGEIARNRLDLVRMWGRKTIDELYASQPDVFVRGDPRETLMRFQVLRQTLFDFPVGRVTTLRDGWAEIQFDYGASAEAEEAALHQSMGFLERLVELSGASRVDGEFKSRKWAGDPVSTIQLRWAI